MREQLVARYIGVCVYVCICIIDCVCRFGKLKLGIVSEATEIQELATALGIPLFDTILQSLDHVDCLVVDSQWDVINDTLNTAIDTTPNLLKCVVMPATPIPRTIDSQWQSLVPQQSCMTKNGVLVDVSQRYVTIDKRKSER